MIRFLRDSGIYKRNMERQFDAATEASYVTAGDAIAVVRQATAKSIVALEREMQKCGVVADGVTRDGYAMQEALLRAAGTAYRPVALPPGLEMQIDVPITSDASRLGVDLNGGTWFFDYLKNPTPATPLYAVTLTRSQPFGDMRSAWRPFGGGYLSRRDAAGNVTRDDAYNQNISGILLDSPTEPGIARCTFSYLGVEGFRDAMYFGRNCYIIDLVSPRLIRNYTHIASRNVTAGNFSNQGEAINLYGGLLSAHYEAIDIEQIYVNAFGTRWDYPSVPTTAITDIANRKQRMGSVRKGARLFMSGGNFEFRDNSNLSNDTSVMYLADTGSQLIMRDIPIIAAPTLADGTTQPSAAADGYWSYSNLRTLVECSNTPRVLRIDSCEGRGLGLLKDRALFRLSIGNAPRVVRVQIDAIEDSFDTGGAIKGRTAHPPRLADASAAGARNFGKLRRPALDVGPAAIEDYWYIAGSGGGLANGQSNRFTATVGNMYVNALTVGGAASPVGAANELAVRKTGPGSGGTHQLRVRLLCPVDQGTKVGMSLGLRASSAASIPMTAAFVTLQQSTGSSYGNPTTYNGKQIAVSTSLSVTTSETIFTLFNLTAQSTNWDFGDREVPPWATHVLLEIVLDSIDGSGTPFDLFITKPVITCD